MAAMREESELVHTDATHEDWAELQEQRRARSEARRVEDRATRQAEMEAGLDLVSETETLELIEEIKASVPA